MGAVISQPASRGKPARTGRGPSPAQAQAVNGQPPAGNGQPSSQASRIGSGTRGNVPVLYEPLLCGACKASLVFVHDVVTDTTRTRVEPAFEPGLVRQLKSAAEHDMRVGGADLAGQAIKAGLADEVRLFLVPVVVGGGKRALPTASAQIWSYWIRSGSPAVLSTSGTASSQPERWCRSGRPWP
jgi:hypothetical protein